MARDRRAVDDDFSIVVGAGAIISMLGLVWAAVF